MLAGIETLLLKGCDAPYSTGNLYAKKKNARVDGVTLRAAGA
ncbi:hypothetical protein VIBNISFn118_470069 [Vibrio nigripulchritudo SFn118]|nr:hypothetical protein VIBNISFn118_470069 [Vibrio nigripulchritudo SFn118]